MMHSVFTYQRDPKYKSKYLLEGYSEEYLPLLGKTNKGEVPLYIGRASHVKSTSGRVPAYGLTGAGGKYVSGVFLPEIKIPDKGYGDFSEDGLLIGKSGDKLDIMVSHGSKFLAFDLWTRWADDDPELLEEIEDHLSRLRQPD